MEKVNTLFKSISLKSKDGHILEINFEKPIRLSEALNRARAKIESLGYDQYDYKYHSLT